MARSRALVPSVIGWTAETDMRFAELNKRKRCQLFTVGLAERREQAPNFSFAESRWVGRVQHPDAEGGAGNFQK